MVWEVVHGMRERFDNVPCLIFILLFRPCYFVCSLSHTLTHNTENLLSARIPELERSLESVKSLKEKKEQGITSGVVRYNLSDQIYAKAEVEYAVGTVNLWLGANVMLEYTYEEAVEFLQSKRDQADAELRQAAQDLAFVRDQVVTSEVNRSRIFNWDVRRKRKAPGAGAAAALGAETK